MPLSAVVNFKLGILEKIFHVTGSSFTPRLDGWFGKMAPCWIYLAGCVCVTRHGFFQLIVIRATNRHARHSCGCSYHNHPVHYPSNPREVIPREAILQEVIPKETVRVVLIVA